MDVLLPLAMLALATTGLVLLVEPFVSWYYQWAWWSYIFAVDAINRRLVGRSLLRDQRREFLRLAALSVALWTLFEALNLRLGNWYYVMDHPWRAVRWAGGVVAFATVIPGILETEALFANLGWLRHVRVRPLKWSSGKEKLSLVIGLASLALPLLWPDLFFPLAWGALVFLLEPWNRRHGRRSRLRDLEMGEAGPLLRALLAGLVCGLLWEVWNFWARTKWVYTVPGFEELKLFEMPLLGFLGFPPFAVECLAVVSFFEWSWERVRGRGLRGGVLAATAAGTLAVFAAADARTVDSLYAPVEQLWVLPATVRSKLATSGLRSPEALLRALRSEEGRQAWSARTGLSASELDAHRERVALVMHRGLGQERARELAALGIETRQDLARWPLDRLVAGLRAAGARGPDPFLARRARVWRQGLR